MPGYGRPGGRNSLRIIPNPICFQPVDAPDNAVHDFGGREKLIKLLGQLVYFLFAEHDPFGVGSASFKQHSAARVEFFSGNIVGWQIMSYLLDYPLKNFHVLR